jgi:DNA (cytosine-5)-methyltransferase 1
MGERALCRNVGAVDLVVAGPPCQGHSDLNNHTRRIDSKNQLVLKVVRFVELFEPSFVLIENVPAIRHDRLRSIATARIELTRLGYQTTEGVLDASELGVPQRRRRYFLFASRKNVHALADVVPALSMDERTLRWAIEDLRAKKGREAFDTASVPTPSNRQRIDYLFEHDLYDLPDSQRPDCHSDGGHTYRAVYGRLQWNTPAPTLTTGFGCMGQGRFVHPSSRRTLTPHEAARLQFFPDFFRFGDLKRTDYQQLIGNAVPSKLAYAVLVHQLA